ncbi:MAG: MATE family efflux transporter [Clostridia bacterium]|nr:MATE family efflux transporter [Clostridia bacterium]
MDNAKRLGEEKIGTLLWKFSIPAIIGMLVNALYNVVDRIFIGQTEGSIAIAGLTITFPVMIIILAFAMLVGIGGAARISINLGKKQKEEAEKVMGNALILMVGIGLMLTVLGLLLLTPILTLFNASDLVRPYARAYLSIILFGSVFQMVSFGINRFIGAEGNAVMAMMTMLIGAIVNIILDAIFIMGMGMGVQGAALGTIIAQLIASIWVLAYFLRGKSLLKFRKKNLRLENRVVMDIFSIGSAPFAMQIASCCILFLFNRAFMMYGGDIGVSAFGIIYSFVLLILMPVFGINQGCQPIIGYNYGAKQYDRIKQTLVLAGASATFIVLIGFVLSQYAPEFVISVFNANDGELIEVGSKGIKVFLTMFPVVGVQIICSNYFQAVGKPKKAMFLSLTRQVIFLIPLILLLPLRYGLLGVWLAAPVSDFFSFIVGATAIFREMKSFDSHPIKKSTPDLLKDN